MNVPENKNYWHKAAPSIDLIDIDTLGTMPDEDLVIRMRMLESDMNKVYDAGHVDARPWEEEIAYVRREQQIRRSRRDAFIRYEREVQSEFEALERSLPAGDFDNTAFVYAANGGRPRWN